MRAMPLIVVGLLAACGGTKLQPSSTGSTTGGAATGTTGFSATTGTTTGSGTTSSSSSSGTSGTVVCQPGAIATYTVVDPDSEGLAAVSLDGGVDLVVSAGNNVDDLFFFQDDGGGGFALAAPVLDLDAGVAGSVIPGPVVFADLNGDGLPDMVVCNFEDSVWVLLNQGSGQFSAPDVYPIPCFWLATVDSTNTGRLDLAIAAGGSEVLSDGGYLSQLTVLLNDGGGRFSDSLALTGYMDQSGVAVGDLDGDGWSDLVAVGDDNVFGKVEVYLNNRDGGFGGPVEYQAPSWAGADVVGDFTGDGKLDVAVINYPGGQQPGVVLYTNLGGGVLDAGSLQPSNCGSEAAAAADLNGDGKLDLAVVGRQGLEIWLQEDGGLVPPATVYDAGGYLVLAADLNGDGHADLAITGSGTVNSWLTVVPSDCH